MTHSHYQQNSPLLLNHLYCQEEHWEEIKQNFSVEDKEEEEESHYINCTNPKSPFSKEHDLLREDEDLSFLFSKEQQNHLYIDFENNPSLAEARQEAVEWMLKVVSHYSFSALTAVLAVNYLDRFLFIFQFQREKPWMIQLAAVACLSLSAKVEETDVPLLLDLQVEETKYMFEAKTIQRMELLVLSTLQWKMNPITPIEFLDYIAKRLGLKGHICWEFLKRCQCLLLSIISDCRVMCYLPSIMATATILHVINSLQPCTGIEYQDQLLGILGIDKQAKVDDCFRLIQELASRVNFYSSNKRKFRSLPGSPKGVMDLSFTSDDSSNESSAMAASVSSSLEPLSKKGRAT